MKEILTAKWKKGDEPCITLELPGEVDIYFVLMSESLVKLVGSVEEIKWGDLVEKKIEAERKGEEEPHDFKVLVFGNASWSCEPVDIIRRVVKLKETISRRNLQIKNLRKYTNVI